MNLHKRAECLQLCLKDDSGLFFEPDALGNKTVNLQMNVITDKVFFIIGKHLNSNQ